MPIANTENYYKHYATSGGRGVLKKFKGTQG